MRYSPLCTCVCTAALAVLATNTIGCAQDGPRPIRVLMVAAGEHHDYDSEPTELARRLTERGGLQVDLTSRPAELNQQKLSGYDVLLFDTCQQEKLSDDIRQSIMDFVRSGKGLAAMHCSLWSYQDWPQWFEMLGGFVQHHDKIGPFSLTVLDPDQAITLGQGREFELFDEPYLVDRFDPKARVLIRTTKIHQDQDGKRRSTFEPQVWTKSWGKGRVFVMTFGHDQRVLNDERVLSLLHKGLRWATDRLPEIPHNVLTDSEKKAGFELLFNGKDLTGWSGNRKYWSVEDGELVGRSADLEHNIFLTYTRKEYGDFILKAGIKLRNHNSGIQFRSRQFPDDAVKGYQADAADKWWGSLYEEGLGRGVLANGYIGKGEKVVIPDGWNDLTVQAVGPKITITLNGLTTVEYVETDPAQPAQGVIALQLHRGTPMEVRFRDIRIQPLEKQK